MILALFVSSLLSASSSWAKSEEIKIPPPAVKPKPVAKLPPTFVEAQRALPPPPVQFEKLPMAPIVSTIQAKSIVMESIPESFGEVVVTDTNTNTVGPFQHVLIRSNRVSTGQVYTVIKDMGRLKWDEDLVKVNGEPHSIQLQGEVKILGTVRVPKLNETLWRAQVTKSYNPVEVGGILSEIKIPRVNVEQKGLPVAIDGSVIGGDLDLRRRLLEPGATVFLDSGVSDGMRVGQLIEVYSTQSLYSVRAALVRVVYVDQQFATAVIVTADREVLPGDRLSRPN